jgi:steroid 5-alpha reductase family enzyme
MPNQLLNTFGFAALAIWIYMSIWFLVAYTIKRNDVADAAWGLGFVVASVIGLFSTQNFSFSSLLVAIMVIIWGLRLSWHIGIRNSKKSEDYRYRAWRDNWGKWFALRSYLQIFIFQGLLMLLIATPVFIIYNYSNFGLHPLTLAGSLFWVFGFLFESIGDRQLSKFISDPKNKGRLMKKGLWRYSRHPNYFGEITQWWAIGIIALSTSYGWLGLIGPIVITFLIVKVSGIPLLEAKYSNNPEYKEYKLRTSVLIPFIPKR